MLKIYNIFYNLFFLPLMLILSVFSKKIRTGTITKLGKYNFKNENKTLWFHAVSVGEVMLAKSVIENLHHDFEIVLSTSTPQGQKFAQEKLSEMCKQITYFPYDTKFAIKKAIQSINPKAVYIIETEIWPNLAKELKDKNIPISIINARISDSTFNSYKKFKFFFKDVLKNYSAILAQSDSDAQKYIAIGANQDIVQVSGNIKFDIKKPDAEIKEKYESEFKAYNKDIIAFCSTHSDENAYLIFAYKKMLDKKPDLKLLIAPRHLETVKNIEKMLSNLNISYSKRSEQGDFEKGNVLILDTTGELASVYSIVNIAVIAGSFNKTGGHNPLEATIFNKPTITGKNIKNFKYIYSELFKNNCSFLVKDLKELEQRVFSIFDDKDLLKNLEENCKLVMEKNSGALKYTENFIKKQGDKNANKRN